MVYREYLPLQKMFIPALLPVAQTCSDLLVDSDNTTR
jgi:hypothetical protein